MLGLVLRLCCVTAQWWLLECVIRTVAQLPLPTCCRRMHRWARFSTTSGWCAKPGCCSSSTLSTEQWQRRPNKNMCVFGFCPHCPCFMLPSLWPDAEGATDRPAYYVTPTAVQRGHCGGSSPLHHSACSCCGCCDCARGCCSMPSHVQRWIPSNATC